MGAIAFYERAGFGVIVERWQDYYGAGEGALIMRSDRA
jgi:ribosomal protein S18 acetylase RimI-like enzyme